MESTARAERFDLQPAASPAYAWEVPQKPISVRIPFVLIDKLEGEAVENFRSLNARGSEIGGVLYGHVSSGEPFLLSVEDYELIACDYSRGPLYRLSDADLSKFDRIIAQHGGGTTPVAGFFRSHTRKGLALDAEDIALFESRFKDPRKVALLIRPFATKACTAGFFMWENGAVRAESSYLEFPFRSSLLTAFKPAGELPDLASAGLGGALPAPSVPKTATRAQIVPIASRREMSSPVPPFAVETQTPPSRATEIVPQAPAVRAQASPAPVAPLAQAKPTAAPVPAAPVVQAAPPAPPAPVAPPPVAQAAPPTPVAPSSPAATPAPVASSATAVPAAPAVPAVPVVPAALAVPAAPAVPAVPVVQAVKVAPRAASPVPAKIEQVSKNAPQKNNGPKNNGQKNAAQTSSPAPVEPVKAEPVKKPDPPAKAAAVEAPAAAETEATSVIPAGLLRGGKVTWIALGAVVPLILMVVMFIYPAIFRKGRTANSGTDSSALSLRVERTGGELQLSWNRDSDPIRNATSGVLSISDGPQHQDVQMDLVQLQKGSIAYTPASTDVVFRMEVSGKGQSKTASEMVRALSTRPSPMPEADQQGGKPGTPAAATKTPDPVANATTPDATEPPVAETPAKRTLKPFQAESLSARLHPAPASNSEVPDAPSLGRVESTSMALPSLGTSVGAPPMAPVPAPTKAAPVTPAAPAAVEKKLPAGGQIQQAVLLRKKEPEYPRLARETGTKGLVELTATIGADGKVKKVTVVKGHPMLVKAASDAVMQWLYKPTVLNGVAVEAQTNVVINFMGDK